MQSHKVGGPSGGSNRNSGNNRPRQPGSGKSRSAAQISTTIVLVLATLALCLFLAVFVLQSASDLFGLNQPDEKVTIVIPEGVSLKDVSNILGNAGVVDKKVTFRLYAGIKGDRVVLNAGDYEFNKNMSYDQIFTIMRVGDRSNQFAKITFTEDQTLDDIAKALEEQGVCKAEDFLKYLQTEDLRNYTFFNMLPEKKVGEDGVDIEDFRYLKLEGYAFPDTYEFYVPEKISSVADKFLGNFENYVIRNQTIMSRMNDLKMDLDEVVTLASIIQKEAGDPTEMRKVSSVFHNRLDNPSNFSQLQSDVTIFYAEDHIKNQNRSYTIPATQDVLDAYNTYVRKGLPVGPICNPGEDAIMAALYPAETTFYYFVTDIEGKYYYASTLPEHNANVALAASQDTSGEGWVGGIKTHDEGDAQK